MTVEATLLKKRSRSPLLTESRDQVHKWARLAFLLNWERIPMTLLVPKIQGDVLRKLRYIDPSACLMVARPNRGLLGATCQMPHAERVSLLF